MNAKIIVFPYDDGVFRFIAADPSPSVEESEEYVYDISEKTLEEWNRTVAKYFMIQKRLSELVKGGKRGSVP